MEKKYKVIKVGNYFRIKALKDFQLITGEIIKKRTLGGLIECEHNLSQEGNCWIEYYAKTIGKSRVMDNAVLKDYSVARDNSTVSGNAVMKDHSYAFDNSTVSGNTVMKDYSRICDSSTVSEDTVMKDYSKVRDNATVSGNAVMKDYSCADGNSIITGNALLQADQCIKYGAVITDLLGTKDWAGALYAELGVVPNDNKVVLYKKAWSTDDESVFKSDYDRNFLYKIGETATAKYVDEDVFEICTYGLHFTSLEFINDYDGDAILKCEIDVPDIITVYGDEVRARKCRVLRVYKEE